MTTATFWILIIGVARGLVGGYTNANQPTFGSFNSSDSANWIIFTSSTDLVNYVNANSPKNMRIFAGNEYSLSLSPKSWKLEGINHSWKCMHSKIDGDTCSSEDNARTEPESHCHWQQCSLCGKWRERKEDGKWVEE